MPIASFIIKNNFQRRNDIHYEDILTSEILEDVCFRITGQREYSVTFDSTDYNKGRLAKLEYRGEISYISFSEFEIRSRNSFFQSFPTALVKYHEEENPNKRIFFYFLPPDGNIETNYFRFMYRLMKTAGTEFLNDREFLNSRILPFSSVEDIILNKNNIRDRNRSNNSTFLTKDEYSNLEIFGKTYGANKYETTLLCLAIAKVATTNIILYEIQEGNLRQLPRPARELLNSFNRIRIITSDLTLEREEFEKNDSLRSPSFIYNLLEKLGDKKCCLCGCEIPQLIQGAHIWPVANIKRTNNISRQEKIQHALDGDNGIWLCNNHHKLFDIDLIMIDNEGGIKYKSDLREIDEDYVCDFTNHNRINTQFLTPNFLQYLERRNNFINPDLYTPLDL